MEAIVSDEADEAFRAVLKRMEENMRRTYDKYRAIALLEGELPAVMIDEEWRPGESPPPGFAFSLNEPEEPVDYSKPVKVKP
jgi:hypothetical protein